MLKNDAVLQCVAFSSQRQHANTVWAKWLQKRCHSLPPASDLKRWLVAAQLLSKRKERIEIQKDTTQVLLTLILLWPFLILPISEPKSLSCSQMLDNLFSGSSVPMITWWQSIKMLLQRFTSVLKRTLHKTAMTQGWREFSDISKRQVKKTI